MNFLKSIFFILLLMLVFTNSVFLKSKNAPEIVPPIEVLTIEGKTINIKDSKGKIILFLFLPDCDHCQREAAEISKNKERFKNYSLFFISSSELYKIEQFSKQYNFEGLKNIHFAFVDPVINNNTFGVLNTPSMFIYNERKELIQKFIGETTIKEIIKAL